MSTTNKFLFALSAFAIVALGAIALPRTFAPKAEAQCTMPGMSHAGAGGAQSQCDMSSMNHTTGIAIQGKVVAINKTNRIVTLQIEAPLARQAQIPDLKPGERVIARLQMDEKGQLVASSVTRPAQSNGAFQTAAIRVGGMRCEACADRIAETLRETQGVKDVTVTVDPPRATVSYDPAQTNPDALKDVIRKTEPIHAGTPFTAE